MNSNKNSSGNDLTIFVPILIICLCLILCFIHDTSVNTEIVMAIFVLVVICCCLLVYNPFKSHPIFEENIDVSGRRQPYIEDLIDEYLIENGIADIEIYNSAVSQWAKVNEEKLSKYKVFSNHRKKQFLDAQKEMEKYTFIIYRNQTRYRQSNYTKSAYNVEQVTNKCVLSYAQIMSKYNNLAEIDFECTLRQYNLKNQRKLMTKQLRKTVMERDNYTCQCCGKYMPDEVGLQIDHIIPINKGGKTVLSNLQVLCSKCNGRKSDKL